MKPSQEFTIKVLDPEDYEKLPYNGAQDSFGMAVMKTKTAYVRRTGIEELDQSTIEHEFDELMAATSEHEIDGIRYKSGGGLGKILGPVIGTIVGMVTGLPPLGAAVGAAISGGTQAHSQSVKPEKYGSGFGGIAQAGIGGGLGAFGGSSLINAGRVAATNAAIAGNTGNTLGTFAQGLKGAASSALGTRAGSSAYTGAKSAFAPQQTIPEAPSTATYQTNALDSFTPSTPTAAFVSDVSAPLSRPKYDETLSKLSGNYNRQRRSVVDLFRGKGSPTSNTAYNRALTNTKVGYDEALDQFKQDQRKLGSTFV